MPTPNLAITHGAASQNQKEVTLNAALDALDQATQGELAVNLSAGNVALTDAEFRSAFAFRSVGVGGGGAGDTLTVPAIRRLFYVNNADGTATLIAARGITTVNIPAGEGRLLYADGATDGLFQAGGGGGGGSGTGVHLLSGAYPGTLGPGERVFHFIASVPFTLEQNLPDSQGKAKTAAASQADFAILKNGTGIGTLRFAAGASSATFVFGAAVPFSGGDELEILAPDPADATLADLAWTLKGE